MKKSIALIWPGLLLLFWIILCEKYNFEVLLIGIVVAVTVYYLNRNFLPNRELKIHKLPLYALYVILLLKEIVLANISVAKIVLSPKINVSPCIVKIKTQLNSSLHRAILANSITLTPGTLTLQLTDDELVIHCLVKENIPDLVDSKFEKLLLKIEG
ncbi:MAG: sodium:proton antiporter [Clostridia bacterium]|nr:sodium:proton antiporter [Clostridia bacterium]